MYHLSSMAESIVKDFKGKLDWVYVGKAEAPKPVEKKPDIFLNEYMQKVFDVAAPVAVAEISEASAAQGLLAKETVGLAGELPKNKFIKKWLEFEKKYCSPGCENRLGKLVTGAVYMAGSLGLNYGSNLLANKIFLNPDKKELRFLFGRSLTLDDKSGNKEMLKAGWEYVTDALTEVATNRTVQWFTNREDVGFVSPLSRTIGKLGNTFIAVFGDLKSRTPKTMFMNSLVNPGFIEGFFRFASAIPGAGFIKELYGKANAQVMKGEGAVPFGSDLAFNMLIAKMMNRVKPGGSS